LLAPPPPAPRRRAGSNCSSWGQSPGRWQACPAPTPQPPGHGTPSATWGAGGGQLPAYTALFPCPPAPTSDVQPVGLLLTPELCPASTPSRQAAAAAGPAVAHLGQQGGRRATEPLGQLEPGVGLDSRGVALRQGLGRQGGGQARSVRTLPWQPGFTFPCVPSHGDEDDGCLSLWSYCMPGRCLTSLIRNFHDHPQSKFWHLHFKGKKQAREVKGLLC